MNETNEITYVGMRLREFPTCLLKRKYEIFLYMRKHLNEFTVYSMLGLQKEERESWEKLTGL